MMFRWSLCFLLVLSARAFSAPVSLRDLNEKDVAQLRAKLPELFKDNPDLATLDEAIRITMAQGTYENVFVERRTDGSYEIIGKPVRLIETVEFKGLNKIEESELREFIDMKAGERFDRKRSVSSGEKIKNYYGEHGFFNAIVEVSFEKLPNHNIRVVYTVIEKEPCIIQALEFKTANTDLKARLDARFSDFRRRRLTTDRARKLANDLNDVLVGSRYLAAEVVGPEARYDDAKTKAWLTYEIREPYRWEFYFSGYRFETMTDLLHALDLRNRERRNVEPAAEGADRLRRRYLEDGFPNVQIETKIVNPKDTYLRRVYYAINEGPRVRIKNFEIQGRVSRPARYYQNFITSNSSSLIARGYYNRADLETGFKNLTTDLRNQGYLKARVLSSRIEFNDKRDQVNVVLLLEEGPQTQIRALDFEGNKFFSSFELAGVTGLETNGPLNLNSFEDSLERLKTFYRNQGFLEMRLLNEKEDIVTYNDKGTQARIAYKIYEGPRIRVHAIAVEGNTITQTRVILKEADFQIGEVLTPGKLEDSTARLNKLGLFSRVDIHTLEEGTNVAERTLVITVADRDPGVFRMGAGVTNERRFTVRGFTGVGYSNIEGSGRGASIRGELKENVAQINYPEHEITVGFLEPFLFNTRTRGRVSITRSEHVFNYNIQNTPQGTFDVTQMRTINRLDLMAERDLTLRTKMTWRVWSLESSTDWERHSLCPYNSQGKFDPLMGKCPEDTLQTATFGPTLDIDYRDNPFSPTRGTFTRLVLEYSDPAIGSSRGVKFWKTEGNFTHFLPLPFPRVVLANSLRGGYERNLSDDAGSGIPTNYAFLLGGIYTVRGYEITSPNERIPKDGAGKNADGKDFVVLKGNQKLVPGWSSYYLFKSELRFPIWGEHGGVLFYDGGAVQISGYVFGRTYRDSVGFGYRYNTPVGPLAMDFAFKIHPQKYPENPDLNESDFRFHLSIGGTF